MVDPFSLAAMGIGTLASLGGGIADAAAAPGRKQRFLEDEKRKAQILALRNSRWTDFYPTNALDAMHKKYDVQREADENPAFNASPMSFLPFVQNATQLAGGIYDYANKPATPTTLTQEAEKAERAGSPVPGWADPRQLQKFTPEPEDEYKPRSWMSGPVGRGR